MNYSKYDNHKIFDFAEHIPELSTYNANLYIDINTQHNIFAYSDDDNCTVYIDKDTNTEFAESYTSENNIMHVYSNYLIDDK